MTHLIYGCIIAVDTAALAWSLLLAAEYKAAWKAEIKRFDAYVGKHVAGGKS